MTREKAIEKIENLDNCYNQLSDDDKEALEMAIKALEQEPKTGHWIYTLEDWNKWECSECGFTKRTDVHVNIGYKYCPECGAKMIKEVKK